MLRSAEFEMYLLICPAIRPLETNKMLSGHLVREVTQDVTEIQLFSLSVKQKEKAVFNVLATNQWQCEFLCRSFPLPYYFLYQNKATRLEINLKFRAL